MKALRIAAWATGTLVVVALILYLTGWGQRLALMAILAYYGPAEDFDPSDAAPAPDYANATYWAALPDKSDLADLVPAGVAPGPEQGQAPADVFFIHPTGLLSGEHWNSPLDQMSPAEQNTQWMMANQASVFNGCCNVFAPRYREASIFAYFQADSERDRVLGLAYDDVRAAFRYFIEHHNDGRPFIVASHSQGTHHARRLLAEEIDKTPLYERFVAGYTIGSVNIAWSKKYFASMQNVAPCKAEDDLGCVVHWDTWADGGSGVQRATDSLCTNPLSWRVDEQRADARLHDGGVPPTGAFQIDFTAPNAGSDNTFGPLAAPLPGQTWAQCRDGTLYVQQQDAYFGGIASPDGNYHGLDYPLFHMDIRNNAVRRVAKFLALNGRPGDPQSHAEQAVSPKRVDPGRHVKVQNTHRAPGQDT